MDEIGREIRRLREEKGWTQAKLAVDADIGVAAVSLIETGKRNPSATTLAKIAEALGVGVAALFPLGQSTLPNFEQRRETAARGPALERYESLRPRLFEIEQLGWHEQSAVFDESLRLFKDLLLNDLHDVLTDAERREQNLVMDILQQATWHILALWELGQERGELGENVVNLEEARAAKARLKAAG